MEPLNIVSIVDFLPWRRILGDPDGPNLDGLLQGVKHLDVHTGIWRNGFSIPGICYRIVFMLISLNYVICCCFNLCRLPRVTFVTCVLYQ